MTMAVIERTREIGMPEVVGAKDSFIVKLFLLESTIIGVIGECGIAIGLAPSYTIVSLILRIGTPEFLGIPRREFALPQLANITPIITLLNIIIALILGIAVGVLAGIYPTYRAYKLKPVKALRYV